MAALVLTAHLLRRAQQLHVDGGPCPTAVVLGAGTLTGYAALTRLMKVRPGA
ncbi:MULTISPECIES: hypothetical protein [Streptomyces]|uniref:hypothetical protein n=1 Tax=Streptomyces TaxID=1883 RepID=UPI001E282B75|nr:MULTISPECIES: hypothetical protein [Streptomyces]UFQ13675.1 hypothetical protein J2N69_00845 [Streptomyces huasconensis]WCL83270.1 hypothetical protein PPN52_00835 [Streptomyces sp. JCM 35825]